MKKKEQGSILLLVIVVFAVILLMGSMLITKAQVSHRYAIRETAYQQAHYVAKSIVDAVREDIMEHSTDTPEIRFATWKTKTSAAPGEVVFTDDVGNSWHGKVKVEDSGTGYAVITADVEGTGDLMNVGETLEGIIKIGDGTIQRGIENITLIDIRTTGPFQATNDIVSINESVKIQAKDKMTLKKVEANSGITLDLKEGSEALSSEKLKVEHLHTFSNSINITVTSQKPVEIDRIDCKGVVTIEAPEVTINEYVRAETLTIKAGSIKGAAKVQVTTANYKKPDGSNYPTIPYTGPVTAPTVSAPTASGGTSVPVGITPVVIQSDGDITIYQEPWAPPATMTPLRIQYFDGATMKDELVDLDKYYILKPSSHAYSIYIGIKRTSTLQTFTPTFVINAVTGKAELSPSIANVEVKGINAEGKTCRFYLDSSKPPRYVHLLNNQNVTHAGSYYMDMTGALGFQVWGQSKGLSIGPEGWQFIQYE